MKINNNYYNIILPCHFGLEAVAKKEIIDLGFDIVEVKDGEIKIKCQLGDIPKLNINLRTVERVLIEIANFNCYTFEELYQSVLNSKIEDFIEENDAFIISKANQDKNSVLHSSQSIQSIVKKAMVDRLKKIYNTDVLPENNKEYKFRVKFYKNNCSLRLDTTGNSLHKRGYRIESGIAPIEETLAASIIMLTPFKNGRMMLDPFCGSGTFCIESAMISINMAPGIKREFLFEKWDKQLEVIKQQQISIAKSKINYDFLEKKIVNIYGYDINKQMIYISKENAKRAGVIDLIHFEKKEVRDICIKKQNGFIITNPPYGERIKMDDNVVDAYKDLKLTYDNMIDWSMFVITSIDDIRKYLGKENKNRKIYNGMIKTYLYSYYGNYKKSNK